MKTCPPLEELRRLLHEPDGSQMARGDEATAQEQARFRVEGEAIARLQHPNIVQVYEVGASAGRPYLAMEYVDGGSLAERLTGDPLVPRAAAAVVEALARAVHYAHGR